MIWISIKNVKFLRIFIIGLQPIKTRAEWDSSTVLIGRITIQLRQKSAVDADWLKFAPIGELTLRHVSYARRKISV